MEYRSKYGAHLAVDIIYDATNKITSVGVSQYDAAGHRVEHTIHAADGQVWKRRFKYDDQGHLIKKLKTIGKSPQIPKKIQTLVINEINRTKGRSGAVREILLNILGMFR